MLGLTVEEHHAKRNIGLSPPRRGKWRADVRDLRPVECDERHAETGDRAEELVDDDVVRYNPAYPVGERKGGKNVAGHEVPAERRGEAVEEEALARNTTTGTHTGIVLRVQGVEEHTCDEISRPDHGWRVDQEAASNATNREADLLQELELFYFHA